MKSVHSSPWYRLFVAALCLICSVFTMTACESDPCKGGFGYKVDVDGDGICSDAAGGDDCDDTNSNIHPGAQDVCEPANVDENCDGEAKPCKCIQSSEADGDGDGICSEAAGGDDCDDRNPNIHPGAHDTCDPALVDENCDGEAIPCECNGSPDSDTDGDGVCSVAEGGDDCDDANPGIHPGAQDACDPANVDENCDGEAIPCKCIQGSAVDTDADGYCAIEAGGDDCDDKASDIHPEAQDACDPDGVDADCSGAALPCDCIVGSSADIDSDAYCAIGSGGDDCDDSDPSIHPNAEEICDLDNVDENCDGKVTSCTCILESAADFDDDGDCSEAAGGDDCNDSDSSIHPGAQDVCDPNGVDADCSGAALPCDCIVGSSADIDGDAFCAIGAGGEDCDDLDPQSYPGAEEVCGDGLNQDCGDWDFDDRDGDSFGDEATEGCFVAQTQTELRGDCDDGDSKIHPFAPEISEDGIDSDCGGTSDSDPHLGAPNSRFEALQPAIDAAIDGQIIWVNEGFVSKSKVSFMSKRIQLRSVSLSNPAMIDAEGEGRAVLMDIPEDAGESPAPLIDGFIIENGRTFPEDLEKDGAGILVSNGDASIRHCILRNNFAAGVGGGVAVRGANAIVEHSSLIGNGANGGLGGGLSVTDGAIVQVLRSNFTANAAPGKGGGIGVQGVEGELSFLTVEDSLLSANSAEEGGNLNGKWADIALLRSTLSGVITGSAGGGGMYLESARITALQTTIRNNLNIDGGGICLKNSSGQFQSCRIEENTSTVYGSGVFLREDFASQGRTVRFENTVFRNNHAYEGAAALLMDGGNVTLQNTLFVGNTAEGGSAAAILVAPPRSDTNIGKLTVNNSVIVGNESRCSFSDQSQCRSRVGGISNGNGTLSIWNSIIAYNSTYNLETGYYSVKTTVNATDIYPPCQDGQRSAESSSVSGSCRVDSTGPTTLNVMDAEPGFLSYDPESCLPRDFHLSLASLFIDAGYVDDTDPDGSRNDLGIYGSVYGDKWDLNANGVPAYYWPGSLDSRTTEGFESNDDGPPYPASTPCSSWTPQ